MRPVSCKSARLDEAEKEFAGRVRRIGRTRRGTRRLLYCVAGERARRSRRRTSARDFARTHIPTHRLEVLDNPFSPTCQAHKPRLYRTSLFIGRAIGNRGHWPAIHSIMLWNCLSAGP